jgi:DNA primase
MMEMDKLSFPDAIKTLARRLGVEICYEDGGQGQEKEWDAQDARKEELFELYRRVAGTFRHFLLEKPEGRPALDYIRGRGVSAEMIERFALGYAPAGRNWLYGFLQGKGYSEEFLDKSGLFSAHHKGFPLFAGRLIFPISDRQGRVVAFGGRALPGAVQSDGKEPPKYINSPEIETYKKGQTLFAIDLALPAIRRTKTVYLAEGYLDVIALHQAGVSNAVAPLGTAFTPDQAALLRRFAELAVLVFDSDEAGQKAAMKGIITCRKNGLSCALAVPGRSGVNPAQGAVLKDPAEILQKFGPETLKKSMECYIKDYEYIIARGKTLYDVSTPGGKKAALALLFPYLNALDSEVEREDCAGFAADSFGVDRNAARKDYSRYQAGEKSSREEVPKTDNDVHGAVEKPLHMNSELFMLTVVALNSALYPEFRAALEIREIEDSAAREIFVALEECFVHEESGMDALLSRISSETLRNFLLARAGSGEFCADGTRDPKKLMEDGIKRAKEKRLRRRLTGISMELRAGERSGYSTEDLIAEKMQIDAEIRKLEGR